MGPARLLALLALASLAVTPAGAQLTRKTPALPAEAAYVMIDDQLFDVGDRVPNGGGRIMPLGATVDSESVTWNQKYNGWEAGVIPIEFDASISAIRRSLFMTVCNDAWARDTLVACIPRTSQSGYLYVDDTEDRNRATDCFSVIGQARRLVRYTLNLGGPCWTNHTVAHELGHAFGFIHEHQRPDRDTYVTIETANVRPGAIGNFTKITSLVDRPGDYDFGSVMHYSLIAFAVDGNHPTIRINPPYLASIPSDLGSVAAPSQLDRTALYSLSIRYYRSFPVVVSTPTQQFDRADFLDAMERLDAFYRSPLGLVRANGLSIDGRPDFLGIATWIFDIYLAGRSAGLSADMSFGAVVADISQTHEWRERHPTWTPGTRGRINASISFDRNEFLDVLNRLDVFYSAPEGLQRPNGLSISGGPDFLGIATWIFDVYLNARLTGAAAADSWTRVQDAIRATDEWRSKH